MADPTKRPSDTYETAFADLLARRQRRRLIFALPDLRPTSPKPLILGGLALALVGWLLPVVHVALTIGLVLAAFGGLTALMRPQGRRVYWRGRPLDLPAEETWATQLYRLLYRGG
jgi:hypothetical protein